MHYRPLPFLLLVAALTGCGTPSLLITPVSNTQTLKEIQVQPGHGWSSGKIAIVDVEGMLLDARTGGFLQPQENKLSIFTEELERAANDSDVKAVVLRVNSPGGTVTASDTMYEILKHFKATTHKPVVASTQDVAASGAYYVCCGADKIVAHPTSVVGSIGVIFNTFNLEGTLNILGARADAIKSGPYKDIGSPFRTITPDERAIMQAMVDEYYARFTNVVSTNRHITDPATLKLVTDGRVFSGQRAVELGLADQTGLLTDALDLARHLSHSANASAFLYKRPFGYTGSIYADTTTPTPQASTNINLPLPTSTLLPGGFYYIWQP